MSAHPAFAFELADAGTFDRPICQAKIEALAAYARNNGKVGAQLDCLGVTVIVLANGVHGHSAPAGRVVEPAPTKNTPRPDSGKP